ncbi:hypothetical protein G5I_11276 [Acromyrmex echinatior]|uniref:Uncharacterized protein n=1 Tax=Acromyrmex echinatior TaxID=103372 RepID=F4WZ64_ACREC|nr:hypothetical protein G5I_11276 [Acromyrmex echinatior]
MYIFAPDSLEFSTAEKVHRPIPGTCSTLPLMLFFSDQAGVKRARWEISLSYSRASGLEQGKECYSFFYSLTVGFQRALTTRFAIGPRKPCPFFFLAGLLFGPLVNVPFGKEQKYRPTRTGRGAMHVVTFRFLTPSSRPRLSQNPVRYPKNIRYPTGHSFRTSEIILRSDASLLKIMKFIRLNNFGYISGIHEDDYNRIFLNSTNDLTLLTLPEFSAQNLCGTNDIPEISQASKSATRSVENRRSIIPLVARAGRSHVRRIVRSADDEERESFEKFADHDQFYSFALRKRVCQLACKNCHEILTSGLILLWSISRGAHIPLKPLENGCPMAEMFIPRTREIWNAATCSTYVNCSAKQAALAFRSAPSRFTPRLHYTISNKPEYCILRSCVFRSSGFSSASVQWNYCIAMVSTTCIVKSIITFEDYVSIIHRKYLYKKRAIFMKNMYKLIIQTNNTEKGKNRIKLQLLCVYVKYFKSYH